LRQPEIRFEAEHAVGTDYFEAALGVADVSDEGCGTDGIAEHFV